MELWVILALTSAILVAAKDVFAKKIFSNKDVSPSQIAFEEYFITFSIMLLIFLPKVEFQNFIDFMPIFFLKAISLGTGVFLFQTMLKKYEISTVSPLINLSPFILLILSTVFLSETISVIQCLGILVIILATYMLEITIHHHSKERPHKHHFKELIKSNSFHFFTSTLILLTAMSFAAVGDKLLFQNGVTIWTNFYFTSLLIIIATVFYYRWERKLIKSIKNMINEPETLIIGFLGFLSSLSVVWAIGIPSSKISLIVPIRRTSTLFSSIFGGILFHEKHLPQKILATFIMLIGVVLIVI